MGVHHLFNVVLVVWKIYEVGNVAGGLEAKHEMCFSQSTAGRQLHALDVRNLNGIDGEESIE